MLLLVVAQLLYLLIPQLLNITALSVLKIIRLMNNISNRCFIVEVNGVQYVVKYGKIDEFLCLFLQEKFGNYDLPSIFDIAYSKDGILKDNVSQEMADALMLGMCV